MQHTVEKYHSGHDAKSLYTLLLALLPYVTDPGNSYCVHFSDLLNITHQLQSLFFTSFHELTQVILNGISKIQYSVSVSDVSYTFISLP